MKTYFKTLRKLSEDLARADATQNLLDEIWQWCGPYGPEYHLNEKERRILETPAGRKILEKIQIPDALRYKL